MERHGRVLYVGERPALALPCAADAERVELFAWQTEAVVRDLYRGASEREIAARVRLELRREGY